MNSDYLSVGLRGVIVVILLQTLYFKFTAHPESVELFAKLGAEPYGRIGTGVIELVVAVLLIWRKTRSLGALLAAGIMVGAIGSHLLVLGIVTAKVNPASGQLDMTHHDGGLLFVLALVVMGCSLALLALHKNELLRLLRLR